VCTEGKGKVVSCHPIPDKFIAVPPKGPILFRGGATHYSDGEGSLTIHMVRDSSLKWY